MSLKQVDTPTKAAAAFVQIRDAIQSGALEPGSRLTLNRLAKDLGMSLTPVREALKLLSAQGLVHYKPHYGTVVSENTWEKASEIYQLRLVLEPFAGELATSAVTDDDLAALELAQQDMDNAVTVGDIHRVPELNWAFHRRLYQVSGSGYLQSFIETLWQGMPFQAISLTPERIEKSSGEHWAMIDSLRAKDSSALRTLLERHINSGADTTRAKLTHP